MEISPSRSNSERASKPSKAFDSLSKTTTIIFSMGVSPLQRSGNRRSGMLQRGLDFANGRLHSVVQLAESRRVRLLQSVQFLLGIRLLGVQIREFRLHGGLGVCLLLGRCNNRGANAGLPFGEFRIQTRGQNARSEEHTS